MKRTTRFTFEPLSAEEHAQLAEALAVAWRTYSALFGEAPHGTVKQMRALLTLALREDEPKRRRPRSTPAIESILDDEGGPRIHRRRPTAAIASTETVTPASAPAKGGGV